MVSSRLLLLLLLVLPLLDGTATEPETGAATAANDPKNSNKDASEVEDTTGKIEYDTSCVPPVSVVMFFTAYGIVLVGLYAYAGIQWVRLMDAKVKLRKCMALELALIQYDEYCERHDLHGRAETFFPACNDGFFLDQGVQDTWLTVNNLRQRMIKVPSYDYDHLNRQNWDLVKREQKKEDTRRKKAAKKEKLKPVDGKDGDLPRLNIEGLIAGLLGADFFSAPETPEVNESGKEAGKAEDGVPQQGDGSDKKEEEKKAASDSGKVEKKEEEKKEEMKEDKEKVEKKVEKKEDKKEDKEMKKEEGQTKKDEKKEEKEKEKKEEKEKEKKEENKEKKEDKEKEVKKVEKKEDKKEEKEVKKEGQTKKDEKKEDKKDEKEKVEKKEDKEKKETVDKDEKKKK